MKTLDLSGSFQEFKEFKNIDRETLMRILEEVFRAALAKRYGSEDNFDIIVNIDKGDLEIFRNRTIVEDGAVTDPNREIAFSDAVKIESDFEVGEELSEPILMTEFGRREILSIRQNLVSKIQDYEKSLIFQKYKEKVGEIIVGEVYQPWNKEVLILDDEKIELVLPKSEQIPADHFRKGDTVRAVVLKVEMKNNNPSIILSRTSPIFLERLLEAEVPEIYDGLITIKKVVRIPGERAKVAVESYDDRIDPIGACIGVKGSRIIGIVKELRNENIDVLQWTSNVPLLIQRALSPAKVTNIDMGSSEDDKIKVYMSPEEVKKGIGKGGCNIKLASMLVDREIEVWREGPADNAADDEEDVLLADFSNEIDGWIIEKLQGIGLDTAKNVLALTPEDVAKRADLEDETVEEVFRILRSEFE